VGRVVARAWIARLFRDGNLEKPLADSTMLRERERTSVPPPRASFASLSPSLPLSLSFSFSLPVPLSLSLSLPLPLPLSLSLSLSLPLFLSFYVPVAHGHILAIPTCCARNDLCAHMYAVIYIPPAWVQSASECARRLLGTSASGVNDRGSK